MVLNTPIQSRCETLFDQFFTLYRYFYSEALTSGFINISSTVLDTYLSPGSTVIMRPATGRRMRSKHQCLTTGGKLKRDLL